MLYTDFITKAKEVDGDPQFFVNPSIHSDGFEVELELALEKFFSWSIEDENAVYYDKRGDRVSDSTFERDATFNDFLRVQIQGQGQSALHHVKVSLEIVSQDASMPNDSLTLYYNEDSSEGCTHNPDNSFRSLLSEMFNSIPEIERRNRKWLHGE